MPASAHAARAGRALKLRVQLPGFELRHLRRCAKASAAVPVHAAALLDCLRRSSA